ncbi:MAG: host specificity protein [Planctomycetaceae bacterium]|nr:host specificity protein [Planctomycetaceae bacterium]
MDTIKARLARGERVMTFGFGRVFHHNLIQILGMQGGFQGFWLDHEHVGLTIREMEIAAATGRSVGMDCFVRIAPTDYAMVTRCLEAGTGGVMAAQIHSAAQAEEFVRWAKFSPRGCRGLNSSGYDGRFGTLGAADFTEKANRETFVAIQVETTGAVEECEAIAAIDGVDHLFVGPADLSQALGVTGQFMHDKCLDAIKRVATACRSNGITWGAVTPTPEHAATLTELGCTLLSPVNEVRIVSAGINTIKSQFADIFSSESTP